MIKKYDIINLEIKKGRNTNVTTITGNLKKRNQRIAI